MTYLVQLTLGPVQGFIATARRSRDLWFGSYILSEISKAAARAMSEKSKLIFPAPSSISELEPSSPFLVANIVIAEADVDDDQSAKKILDAGTEGATDRWAELCADARQQINTLCERRKRHPVIGGGEGFLRTNVWDAQLKDVVEVFAAAVPVGKEGYKQANDTLRDLAANRKNTRYFTPFLDREELPKSSLDGAQSTVIQERASTAVSGSALGWARQTLGIEPSEQLDTAGMVKRVVGRDRGFVPVARLAAAEWIERAEMLTSQFGQLKAAYQEACDEDLGTRLQGKYVEYPWVATFPYDAQLLYRQRIEAEHQKLVARLRSETENAAKAVARLSEVLRSLYGKLGAPNPYYGLLMADGDRMGKLIDRASDRGAEAHRAVSQALSGFAQRVPDLMRDNGGACIYSGGDDVLGLVPLHRAIDIADTLQSKFRDALNGVAEANRLGENEQPTLSVGIAIAHFLEPLGDVRALAVRAEKIAKSKELPEREQRNALAILAKPRSGSEYRARIQWSERPQLDRIRSWSRRMRGDSVADSLPRGLPHELDEAWKRCVKTVDSQHHAASFGKLWMATLKTILDRKRQGGGGEALCDESKEQLKAELGGDTVESSRKALDHLLLARWLSGWPDA